MSPSLEERASQAPGAAGSGGLAELARVPWRSLVGPLSLRRRALAWTLWTWGLALPFGVVACVLVLLDLRALPLACVAAAHALLIPMLHVRRGATVLRRPAARAGGAAEQRALGLLGDLLGHEARDLCRETGYAVERGRLGTWVIGWHGAVLVEPGARRCHCFCVQVDGEDLPTADRTAHLLLALREDERGFATVANHVWAGSTRRLRRRLDAVARRALDSAVRQQRVVTPA